jgi:hypothetical protein
MPKDLGNGLWQCEFPGCNYTNKKPGWVGLHETSKHKEVNDLEKKKGKKDEVVELGKCPECGSGKIRLLNSRNTYEYAVIKAGYKKLCEDCEEVIK